MSTSLQRLRAWAENVHWFAVLALVAVLCNLVFVFTSQSEQLIFATAATGVVLAILSLREE